jgi:fatty acid desaturase
LNALVDAFRAKAIPWADLRRLSPTEVAHELLLSAPWLAASWVAASHDQLIAALACSFMFFLTGLRQVHNAYHYALGLGRPATEWFMFAMSLAMLGSMHAVQINHLRHHRHCMQDEDIEAMSARMPWWKAVALGPVFPWRLHKKALEVATPRQRAWIAAELAANLMALVLVATVLDFAWLQYHVLAMALGQCLTAFFAVWTVHHDCEADALFARTIRGRARSILSYSMFFHVEHHLFPAVPTCKLRVLAQRIDGVMPILASKRVL